MIPTIMFFTGFLIQKALLSQFVQRHDVCEIPFQINKIEEAYLLIELDGNDKTILFNNSEKLFVPLRSSIFLLILTIC